MIRSGPKVYENAKRALAVFAKQPPLPYLPRLFSFLSLGSHCHLHTMRLSLLLYISCLLVLGCMQVTADGQGGSNSGGSSNGASSGNTAPSNGSTLTINGASHTFGGCTTLPNTNNPRLCWTKNPDGGITLGLQAVPAQSSSLYIHK